jgi:hypothetical protein
MNGANRLIEIGRMVVVLCSLEISFIVCKKRSCRAIDGHDAQIHPHHAIDDRNEENQSRPFCAEQLAETENDPALVLAQDADHLRQDDYGEENNGSSAISTNV